VGANVRRIEGVTGRSAVAYYRQRDEMVAQAAGLLGAIEDELLNAVGKLQTRTEALETEVKSFVNDSSRGVVDRLAGLTAKCDGVHVVAEVVEAHDMEHLLSLVDQVRERVQPAVVALGANVQGKGVLVVSASSGLKGINAGEIVKASTQAFGGGGGGTPHLGRGGGDPARLTQAVSAAKQAIMGCLGG
jgi:alanyl-tRNA synthetase